MLLNFIWSIFYVLELKFNPSCKLLEQAGVLSSGLIPALGITSSKPIGKC